MQRLRAFCVNAATALASVIFILVVLEIALRFLPVAQAPDVFRPTAEDTMQRYAPNTSFTWSHEWNFRDVVRGRTNAQGWIAEQPNMEVLYVKYNEVLANPASAASAIAEFLGLPVDQAAMTSVVDAQLYRQRKA